MSVVVTLEINAFRVWGQSCVNTPMSIPSQKNLVDYITYYHEFQKPDMPFRDIFMALDGDLNTCLPQDFGILNILSILPSDHFFEFSELNIIHLFCVISLL